MTDKAAKQKNNYGYVLSAIVCLSLTTMLLTFPSQAKSGALHGVSLCLNIIIPSLFPFLLVSSLVVSSGMHLQIGRLFGQLTHLLFRQPPVAAGVIIMSMIGGLPVGARMTAELYRNGQLTRCQSKRLVLFCINAGPAFVISAVGGSVLGSYKAGGIVYASLLLSSLCAGVLTRFIPDGDSNEAIEHLSTTELNYFSPRFVSALTQAAESACGAILSVCVWVITFSFILSVIESRTKSDYAMQLLASVLEITAGCEKCALLPIPVISGIIAWSGLSGHCQILSFASEIPVSLKVFYAVRVICGALAYFICKLLLVIFPIEAAVGLTPSGFIAQPLSVGIPVSIGLMMMCAVLLLSTRGNIESKKLSGIVTRQNWC